jgi:hypothetical protein
MKIFTDDIFFIPNFLTLFLLNFQDKNDISIPITLNKETNVIVTSKLSVAGCFG